MAVWIVPTSLLPLISASKFPSASGDAHRRLSNGVGIAAFGGELANLGWTRTTCLGRSASLLRSGAGKAGLWKSMQGSSNVAVRGMAENEVVETAVQSEGLAANEAVAAVHAKGLPNKVTEAKGLAYDGPGKGGQWLSSTTRHVRIYIGVADPESKLMDQTQLDKITLILDPDNEFLWPEDKVQKVYDYFAELVDGYAGAPCTEYTLRLIGSDIEHYIRRLLLGNEIKYNLDCRVLNFSMGKPRYESGIMEQAED